jgi:hypothetical protein
MLTGSHGLSFIDISYHDDLTKDMNIEGEDE